MPDRRETLLELQNLFYIAALEYPADYADFADKKLRHFSILANTKKNQRNLREKNYPNV